MGRDDARVDRLLRLARGAGAARRAAKLAGASRRRRLRRHLFHRLARGSSVADRRRPERASHPALGLRTLAALGSQSRHAVCVSFRLRSALPRRTRFPSRGVEANPSMRIARASPVSPGIRCSGRLRCGRWRTWLPNGDLAHVLLFGLFAVFGVIGMAALDGRKRKQWGETLWAERAAKTSAFPFAALLEGRVRLRELRLDPWRAVAALALYATLLAAHPYAIGVSPLPA